MSHATTQPKSFIPYGTAGFRMNASNPNLQIATHKSILYLLAQYAQLLSTGTASENPEKFFSDADFQRQNRFGVMITASHNSVQDNGLKIMDYRGEMWPQEKQLQQFVNDANWSVESIAKKVKEMKQKHGNEVFDKVKPIIVVGWDTRPSCATFLKIVREAVEACKQEAGLSVELKEFGVCTTPELHWTVKEWDLVMKQDDWKLVYRNEMAQRVRKFVQVILAQPKHENSSALKWFEGKRNLAVDTAYGCGGVTVSAILKQLTDVLDPAPEMVNQYNAGTAAEDANKLNHECGAEYVQKGQKFPISSPDANTVYASFDGDADRLVFSYVSSDESSSQKFTLVDGDKIATLFALFVNDRLKVLNLKDEVSVGVVQTAYANGASTNFLQKQVFKEDASGNSVACVATGVKHLHAKAHDFDIGIYFEANGHGTVLFSKKMQEQFAKMDEKEPLRLFANLINQAVGDAIADMFCALCVLAYRGMTVEQWSALYTDYPSLTTKLAVPDRSLIKTTVDERRIISPEGLQKKIDEFIEGLNLDVARTFVRPSGTEDVVRIYAESHENGHVTKIETSIREIVSNHFSSGNDVEGDDNKRKRSSDGGDGTQEPESKKQKVE